MFTAVVTAGRVAKKKRIGDNSIRTKNRKNERWEYRGKKKNAAEVYPIYFVFSIETGLAWVENGRDVYGQGKRRKKKKHSYRVVDK